jgi:integrase
LKKLLRHVRAVFKLARKKKIILDVPTEGLRAKSKAQVCERFLTVDEFCKLLQALKGRDRLIVRIFVQLGLRPEELFGLRRDDVRGNQLRIDEALVFGKSAAVKTTASQAYVYIPADLLVAITEWMEAHPGEPRDWLFQTSHGRPGFLNSNNFRNRVLQSAAIRAGIGLVDSGKKDTAGKTIWKTDVDLRCLRRTCATWFGFHAKDPKSTQTQLRHADPTITLRHYQKSIPESVKEAAEEFEHALGFGLPRKPETIN